MARALPANIRFEWKQTEVVNTLAYYDTATITSVKSFIVQAPGVVAVLVTAAMMAAIGDVVLVMQPRQSKILMKLTTGRILDCLHQHLGNR